MENPAADSSDALRVTPEYIHKNASLYDLIMLSQKKPKASHEKSPASLHSDQPAEEELELNKSFI